MGVYERGRGSSVPCPSHEEKRDRERGRGGKGGGMEGRGEEGIGEEEREGRERREARRDREGDKGGPPPRPHQSRKDELNAELTEEVSQGLENQEATE